MYKNSHWVHDAVLTEKGKSQAAALRDQFPYSDRIDLVISSPLRRAIQTASIALGPTIARPEVNYLLVPMGQEVNDFKCDIGHSPSELKAQIPELLDAENVGFDLGKIDFSLVKDGWNSKTGIYASDKETVKARAAALRSWLYQRSESNILFVTHGAFLHFLTEDWTGDDPVRGTGYHNCEVRLFDFTPHSTADDAHIFETEESKAARVQPV
ncbi:hypothetical protein H2198_006686 [Neophaeococcomyces mojaviensis]|uniref:Uncharacterized protein n=1 Tax=Neophaeococcomyces mojaviensis TaxID=3383035 RepID=A0ACC3A265_9EURO|nr:hypothetical protein H2198_006686 [Knufia sp. JES_112]